MQIFDRHHLKILRLATMVLDDAGVPYVIAGGVASQLYGTRRATHDIDVFLSPEMADRALDSLANAGFRTEKTDLAWLYKAFMDDIMVDIIFRPTGNLPLDQQMMEHARDVIFQGQRLRIAGPEDLLLLKIFAARFVEEPEVFWRHWKDALALMRNCTLNWDYFIQRAELVDVERVLGFLIIARSEGIPVPPGLIRRLAEEMLAPVRV
ncbi:MAG: nucleotidyltransferase [Chloroflexi bacterium]|nr:nucleotidyltransferase [Chloroflexota bacterium]